MYIKDAASIFSPVTVATLVSIVVFVLFVAMIFIFCKCKRSQKKVKKEHDLDTSKYVQSDDLV
jgi:preprotein translocase subunit YajC